MRAFHRLVQRGWGSALWLLVLLTLTACGEDLDYVVIDLSGIPNTAKGLRLSVDVDGGMAPMDGHTGASTARVAVALRRSLSGSYTVVIEAQGEGTCVTARGSLTLQLPRQSSEVVKLALQPVDVDCDGDPATTDCDDKDPKRFHGNKAPRNCCTCTDPASCARDHSKRADVAVCSAACAGGVDLDCGGKSTCFVDEDCDGYSPSDPVAALRDCDDSNPRIYPGAPKDCADPGKDWSCDGKPRAGCNTCGSDADCQTDPNGFLVCDLSKQLCVQCRSDAHCAGIAGRPRCDLNTSLCVQCLSFSTDCSNKATSDQCLPSPASTCACSNNGGKPCDQGNKDAQTCKPGSGCVQCLADKDCVASFVGVPKGNPNSNTVACLASTNRCVQCTNDTHCANNANGNLACDTVNNVCVQCYSANGTGLDGDKYCTGQALNKRCHPSTKLCVQCNTFNTTDCNQALNDICLPTPTNTCACSNNAGAPCNPNNLAAQACKAGVGCVQCLADSNCPIAKFPGITPGKAAATTLACDLVATVNGQANNNLNRCVQCSNDTYCSGATPACLVPNDVCVQCTASNKSLCTGDAVKKQCRLDTNKCVQCLNFATDCSAVNSDACSATNSCTCKGAAQCSGATAVCDTRAGSNLTCVQCIPGQQTACTGATSACNPTNGTCVQCIDRTTCTGATPACDTSANKCVQCTGNADCSGATPLCDTAAGSANQYKCVQCLQASDCGTSGDTCAAGICKCKGGGAAAGSACSGLTPICNTNATANQCVMCNKDADCSGNAAGNACNTTTGQCVQCTAANSAACSGATPTCNTTTNKCVQCKVDANCNGVAGKPRCNTATNLCVECNVIADCGATGNFCDATKSCKCRINGVNNNACVAPQLCNTNATNNVCVECNADADCAANANGKVCNITTGLCVLCTAANTSYCTISNPNCDTKSFTCIGCSNNADCVNVSGKPYCIGNSLCAECRFNADCPANKPTCSNNVCA